MTTNGRRIQISFENFEDLIHKLVWNFRSKHGGDAEELLSAAYERFLDAYYSHERELSQFSTWLSNRIWFGFLDDYRKHVKRIKMFEQLEEPNLVIQELQDGLIENLSSDALTAIQIALDFPNKRKDSIRKIIRGKMKEIGISQKRIQAAFDELKRTL